MTTILNMDRIVHTPGLGGEEDNTPVGTVESVKGKFNLACRFNFAADTRRGYFQAPVKAGPAWDEAAGLSFWVKGDGSPQWGGMELIARDNPRLRYQYEFSISSTRWCKFEVPWCDFMPFLPDGEQLDPHGAQKPSHVGHLNFGKQSWWFEWPAHSFAIDQIQLEPAIKIDTTDYTPTGEPLARVREKLAHRRPIVIATMGDSLTSRYHWANKELCWVDVLSHKLRVHVHAEVAVVNRCMGGHQLAHGLLQMRRWLPSCPQPDLITVWFGGNDWSDGMRRAPYEKRLRFAVDYIRRMTKGSPDIILMTTVPWLEIFEQNDIRELGDAVRTVAAEKKAAVVDMNAAFMRAGKDATKRASLYAWDKVHLDEYGHQVTAETVFQRIVGGM